MDSSDLERLNANLSFHEGMRLFPYDDATGKQLKPGDVLKGNITIGIGHNLSQDGITNPEMFCLRDDDIAKHEASLKRAFSNFDLFSGARQAALIEMCFTMGITRLLGFKKMVYAIRALPPDWNMAADQALDSNWAKVEAPARAKSIADVLRGGIWPS